MAIEETTNQNLVPESSVPSADIPIPGQPGGPSSQQKEGIFEGITPTNTNISFDFDEFKDTIIIPGSGVPLGGLDPAQIRNIDVAAPIINSVPVNMYTSLPVGGDESVNYDRNNSLLSSNYRFMDSTYDQVISQNLSPNPGASPGIRFGLKSSNFDRYYNHPKFKELGFHPYADNESYYNANSTWWDENARMRSQWSKIATTGFMSTYDAIGDWVRGDGYLSPDTDGSEVFEDAMRIGMSTVGLNEKSLSTHYGRFFNNLGLQSGYTVGILSNIALEELALAGLEAATVGGATPIVASRTAYNIVRLGKTVDKMVDVTKASKASWDLLRKFKNLDFVKDFWRAGGRFAASALTPNTYKVLKEFGSAQNVASTLSNWAKVAKTGGAFYRDMRAINLAIAESKLEAGMVRNQLISELYSEFQLDNDGATPLGDDLTKIFEKGNEAAFTTTMLNAPIIYFSNALVFDGALRGFRGTGKLLNETMDNIGSKVLRNKKLTKSPFEAAGKTRVRRFIQRGFNGNLKTFGGALLQYTNVNLAEGFQELFQEGVAVGASDYYKNLYNDPAAGGLDAQLASTYAGIKSQWSGQGFEVFMSGFLMGGLVQGPQKWVFQDGPQLYQRITDPKGFKEYEQKRDEYVENAVSELNKVYNDPGKYFDEEKIAALSQKILNENMFSATYAGDALSFYDSKDASIFLGIHSVLGSGKMYEFRSQIKDYLQLDDEGLAEAFPNATKEEVASGKTRERLEKMLTRMDHLEKSYKELNDKIVNPFDASKYKIGTKDYDEESISQAAFNHAKMLALYTRNTFERALERTNQIYTELASDPIISKIAANDINVLSNTKDLISEIRLLKTELELSKPQVDEEGKLVPLSPEEQAIYNEKEKRLKLLQNFFNVVTHPNYIEKREKFLEAAKDETEEQAIERKSSEDIIPKQIEELRQSILSTVSDEQFENEFTAKYSGKANPFGIFDIDNSEKLKDVLIPYLQHIAETQDDFVIHDKLEELVLKLIDAKVLNGRAEDYNKAIQVIMTPENLVSVSEKIAIKFKKLFRDNKNELEERLLKYVDKIEQNEFLNQLANYQIFPDADQAEAFLKGGKIPLLYYIPDGILTPETNLDLFTKKEEIVEAYMKISDKEVLEDEEEDVDIEDVEVEEEDEFDYEENFEVVEEKEDDTETIDIEKVEKASQSTLGKEFLAEKYKEYRTDVINRKKKSTLLSYSAWLRDKKSYQARKIGKHIDVLAQEVFGPAVLKGEKLDFNEWLRKNEDSEEVQNRLKLAGLSVDDILGKKAPSELNKEVVKKSQKVVEHVSGQNVQEQKTLNAEGEDTSFFRIVNNNNEPVNDNVYATRKEAEQARTKIVRTVKKDQPYSFGDMELQRGDTIQNKDGERFVVMARATHVEENNNLWVRSNENANSRYKKDQIYIERDDAGEYTTIEEEVLEYQKAASRIPIKEAVSINPIWDRSIKNNQQMYDEGNERLQTILRNLTDVQRKTLTIKLQRGPYWSKREQSFKKLESYQFQDKPINERLKKSRQEFSAEIILDGETIGFFQGPSTMILLDNAGKKIDPLNITEEQAKDLFIIYPRDNIKEKVEEIKDNYAQSIYIYDQFRRLMVDQDVVEMPIDQLEGVEVILSEGSVAYAKQRGQEGVTFGELITQFVSEDTTDTIDGQKPYFILDYNRKYPTGGKKAKYLGSKVEGLPITNINPGSPTHKQLLEQIRLYETKFDPEKRLGKYVAFVTLPNGRSAFVHIVPDSIPVEELNKELDIIQERAKLTVKDNVTTKKDGKTLVSRSLSFNNDFNNELAEKIFITAAPGIYIDMAVDNLGRLKITYSDLNTYETIDDKRKTIRRSGAISHEALIKMTDWQEVVDAINTDVIDKDARKVIKDKFRPTLDSFKYSIEKSPDINVLSLARTKLTADVKDNFFIKLQAENAREINKIKRASIPEKAYVPDPKVEEVTELSGEERRALALNDYEDMPNDILEVIATKLINKEALTDFEDRVISFDVNENKIKAIRLQIIGSKLPDVSTPQEAENQSALDNYTKLSAQLKKTKLKFRKENRIRLKEEDSSRSDSDVNILLNDLVAADPTIVALEQAVKEAKGNAYKIIDTFDGNDIEDIETFTQWARENLPAFIDLKIDDIGGRLNVTGAVTLKDIGFFDEKTFKFNEETPGVIFEEKRLHNLYYDIWQMEDQEIQEYISAMGGSQDNQSKDNPSGSYLEKNEWWMLKGSKSLEYREKLHKKALKTYNAILENEDWYASQFLYYGIGTEAEAKKNYQEITSYSHGSVDIANVGERLKANYITVGRFMLQMNKISKDIKDLKGVVNVGAKTPYKYHEAFHGVFRMLLTEEEIKTYLAIAKKEKLALLREQGISLDETLDEMRKQSPLYSDLTRKELEERLYEEYMADEFDKFKMNPRSTKTDSFIKSLFNKIIEFIRNVLGQFTTDKSYQLNALFKNIDAAKYRNAGIQINRFTTELVSDPSITESVALKSLMLGTTPITKTDKITGKTKIKLVNNFMPADFQHFLISGIANEYLRLRNDKEVTNTKGLLKRTILEFIEIYNPDNKRYTEDRGDEWYDENVTEIIEYYAALLDQVDEITEEVNNRLNAISSRNTEIEDEFAEEEADGRVRDTSQWNKEANEIGGVGSLPKAIREFFSLTNIEERDRFGNLYIDEEKTRPIIVGVDYKKVYDGILKAVANEPDQVKMLQKMWIFSRKNPHTKAVVDRFFREIGIYDAAVSQKGNIPVLFDPDQEVPIPKSKTGDKESLYQLFISGLKNFRITYIFEHYDIATSVTHLYAANKKDDAHHTLAEWTDDFNRKYAEIKDLGSEAYTNAKNSLTRLGNLLKIKKVSDVKDLSTEIQEVRNELFENIGINISELYLEFSIISGIIEKSDLTEEQVMLLDMYSNKDEITVETVNEIIQSLNRKENLFLNNQVIEGTPEEAEEGADDVTTYETGGVKGRLRNIALNNAAFDETVGATTFIDAEGNRIYSHQQPTYHLVKIAEMKGERYVSDKLDEDMYLEKNVLLNDPKFQAMVEQGLIETVRIAGSKRGYLSLTEDGTFKADRGLDINKQQGVNYGGSSPREFILNLLHSYLSKYNRTAPKNTEKGYTINPETGKRDYFAIAPVFIRVIEASNTGDMVTLAVDKMVKKSGEGTVITDEGVDKLETEVRIAYERGQRESDPETRNKNNVIGGNSNKYGIRTDEGRLTELGSTGELITVRKARTDARVQIRLPHVGADARKAIIDGDQSMTLTPAEFAQHSNLSAGQNGLVLIDTMPFIMYNKGMKWFADLTRDEQTDLIKGLGTSVTRKQIANKRMHSFTIKDSKPYYVYNYDQAEFFRGRQQFSIFSYVPADKVEDVEVSLVTQKVEVKSEASLLKRIDDAMEEENYTLVAVLKDALEAFREKKQREKTALVSGDKIDVIQISDESLQDKIEEGSKIEIIKVWLVPDTTFTNANIRVTKDGKSVVYEDVGVIPQLIDAMALVKRRIKYAKIQKVLEDYIPNQFVEGRGINAVINELRTSNDPQQIVVANLLEAEHLNNLAKEKGITVKERQARYDRKSELVENIARTYAKNKSWKWGWQESTFPGVDHTLFFELPDSDIQLSYHGSYPDIIKTAPKYTRGWDRIMGVPFFKMEDWISNKWDISYTKDWRQGIDPMLQDISTSVNIEVTTAELVDIELEPVEALEKSMRDGVPFNKAFEAIGGRELLKMRSMQEVNEFITNLKELKAYDKISKEFSDGLGVVERISHNRIVQNVTDEGREIMELYNLREGDLDFNIAQIFLNNQVNATSFNQLLLGDQALTLKDAVHAIKVAKMQNAAGPSAESLISAEALGIMHATDNISMFLHEDDTFTRKHDIIIESNRGKETSEGERTDGHVKITTKGMKHILFGVGKLNPAQAAVMKQIIAGDKVAIDKEFFGNSKLQSHKDLDIILNSMKFVYADGQTFIKMSLTTLIKEFTSIQNENGEWVAREGRESLHNLRVKMEAWEENAEKEGRPDTIAIAVPKSAAKMLKQNMATLDDAYNDKPINGSNITNLQAKWMRLQVINPSNKTTIIDPRQIKNLITNEQDPNAIVFINNEEWKIKDVIRMYRKVSGERIKSKYFQRRNIIFTVGDAHNEFLSAQQGGAKMSTNLTAFLKYAIKGLEASQAKTQMLSYFGLDESEEAEYDLNNPITIGKFEELFHAFFNKGVMSEKQPGISAALVSDSGIKVVKQVKQVDENGIPIEWQVIRSNDWETLKKLDPRKFKALQTYTDIENETWSGLKVGDFYMDHLRSNVIDWDENGNDTGLKYTEFMMPPHFKSILQHDFVWDERLPDAIAKMFGIRIPSQDKHSAVNLKLVDFLPVSMGSSAIFARDLIEISGADFDIDKLYMQIKEFMYDNNEFIEYGDIETDEEGFIHYVKYMVKEVGKKDSTLRMAVEDWLRKDRNFVSAIDAAGDTDLYLDMNEEERVQYLKDLRHEDINKRNKKWSLDLFDLAIADDLYSLRHDEMALSMFENVDGLVEGVESLGLPVTLNGYVEFKEKYTYTIGEKTYSREPYVGPMNNQILDFKYALLGNSGMTEPRDGRQTAIAHEPAVLTPLTDPEAAELMGGGVWEYIQKELPELAESVREEGVNIDNFVGQLRAWTNNKEGARSIGAVVMPNVIMSTLAEHNKQIRTHPVDGETINRLELNGLIYDDFTVNYTINPETGKDDPQLYRKQFVISALITAMTDNAKERLAAKLGLNKNALAITTMMLAMGMDIKTAILLINHPTIKEAYFAAINKENDKGPGVKSILTRRLKNIEDVLEDRAGESTLVSIKTLEEGIKTLDVDKSIEPHFIGIPTEDENGWTDDELIYDKSVIEQFLIAHNISDFLRQMTIVINLQKGFGKNLEEAGEIDLAAEKLGLKMTNKEFGESNIPIDVRSIFTEDSIHAVRYEIFREYYDKLTPAVFISRTDPFSRMYNIALNNFDTSPFIMTSERKGKIKKDLLSYLTAKAYMKYLTDNSYEADLLGSLQNGMFYNRDSYAEIGDSQMSIVDVLDRITKSLKGQVPPKSNYFIDKFISLVPLTSEDNNSGGDRVETNTWTQISAPDLTRIQNTLLELYSNPETHKDAMHLVHYLLVKDGLQYTSGTFLSAVPATMTKEILNSIGDAHLIFREDKIRKSVYDKVFGASFEDLINEFTFGYMQATTNNWYLRAFKGTNRIRIFDTEEIELKEKSVLVDYDQEEGETSTQVLSNLAERPFTYNYKGTSHEFGSVIHAYQVLKSGKFDKRVNNAYKKKGGFGILIESKVKKKSGFDQEALLVNLVKESLIQNKDLEIDGTDVIPELFRYNNFTFMTNNKHTQATKKGLLAAQKEFIDSIQPDGTKNIITKRGVKKQNEVNARISDEPVVENLEKKTLIIDLFKTLPAHYVDQVKLVRRIKGSKNEKKNEANYAIFAKNVDKVESMGFRIITVDVQVGKDKKKRKQVVLPLVIESRGIRKESIFYKLVEVQRDKAYPKGHDPNLMIPSDANVAYGNLGKYVQFDPVGSNQQNGTAFVFNTEASKIPTYKVIQEGIKARQELYDNVEENYVNIDDVEDSIIIETQEDKKKEATAEFISTATDKTFKKDEIVEDDESVVIEDTSEEEIDSVEQTFKAPSDIDRLRNKRKEEDFVKSFSANKASKNTEEARLEDWYDNNEPIKVKGEDMILTTNNRIKLAGKLKIKSSKDLIAEYKDSGADTIEEYLEIIKCYI